MEFLRKDEQKPIYYKINRWSVLAIIGLHVIIVGIIFIFVSRFIYRGVLDDYTILIYILSDYFNMKAGVSFEKCFILFCNVAYNNYQLAISTVLVIGIILCAIGQGITLLGFIKDHESHKKIH